MRGLLRGVGAIFKSRKVFSRNKLRSYSIT
jgi:hypothetical protein